MKPIDDNWVNLLRYKHVFYKMKPRRKTKGVREPHLLTWLLFYNVSIVTEGRIMFYEGEGGGRGL